MPTDVLTLPRTIITPQAPHALPTRPPPAQAARPSSSADPPFLQGASSPAVECDEGTEEYGNKGPEVFSTYDGRAQLPPGVRTPQCREDVGGHGGEPVVFEHDVAGFFSVVVVVVEWIVGMGRSRWWRGEGVFGSAGFAV
mmetsp:Transcript_1224/g.2365  ORF Transcript_1224/g.2365 Transcript_1224/m.2365 type:complete len:140 (-) Transcript_1224:779-1198(-)